MDYSKMTAIPESFWGCSKLHENLFTIISKSPIKVEIISGQDVRDGTLILGTRCGFKNLEVNSLIHELAHLVEIDYARVFKPAWGFKFPEDFPETTQGTRREIRTIAIQKRIYEILGKDDWSEEDDLKALRLLPDYLNVPGKNEEERFLTRRKWFNQEYLNWNLEKVNKELKSKINFLMKNS